MLPLNSLNFARRVSRKLREEIFKVESYIEENGVPKCDYTRFRAVQTNAKRRLADAVRRLISILKMQKQKRLNFTDLVNVLKNPQLAMEISNSIMTSEPDAGTVAAR